jgi:hypothetical protein
MTASRWWVSNAVEIARAGEAPDVVLEATYPIPASAGACTDT